MEVAGCNLAWWLWHLTQESCFFIFRCWEAVMKTERVLDLNSPRTSQADQTGPIHFGKKFCFVLQVLWPPSCRCDLVAWCSAGFSLCWRIILLSPYAQSSMEKWWKTCFEQMLLLQQSDPRFSSRRLGRNKTFCLFSPARLPQQYWAGAALAKLHR